MRTQRPMRRPHLSLFLTILFDRAAGFQEAPDRVQSSKRREQRSGVIDHLILITTPIL
jgi:hypothetical protein